MGEDAARFRFGFNGSVRIAVRGEQLSGNGGAMLLREVDDAIGVTKRIVSRLHDPRDPMLVQYSMAELLRTRLQMIALGFRDQGDADLLRRDPVLRLAVSESAGLLPLGDTTLASQPTMSRLIDTLAVPSNLHEINAGLLEGAIRCGVDGRGLAKERATIDVDSFPVEVHGHQAGSEWNGHYGIRCYHALIAMLHTGHWIGAELQSVLMPALSCTQRGEDRATRDSADVQFRNAATLVLFALAYNLAHSARVVFVRATKSACALDRLRKKLLAVPALVVVSARRATLAVNSAVADQWARFLNTLKVPKAA